MFQMIQRMMVLDYEDIDERIILTSPEEEALMNKFLEWLVSDGGLKPRRSATQHRSVVMSILHFLDSSGKDYKKLFSRSELNSWVTHFENLKRVPGTIKTYLGSVKLFYNFVLINIPTELVMSPSDIVKMQSIVAQWCRNYHKSIKIAKHAKQLEDLSNLPAADEYTV